MMLNHRRLEKAVVDSDERKVTLLLLHTEYEKVARAHAQMQAKPSAITPS
jgi:hypothetical protein